MLTETTDPSVNLYFQMITTMQNLMERSFEVITEHGLTPSQYFMLIKLQRNPKLTQQAIADELHVTKGNISQMVKIMERDGLIIRQQDGAAYRVMVTQKAIDKIEIVIPEHHKLIAEFMSELDDQDITNLQQVMSKFDRFLSE